MKEYSPMVEKNIFKAATNANTDMLLGYKKDGKTYSFLDNYEEIGKEINKKIVEENLEGQAVDKAKREHQEFEIDTSFVTKKE